MKHQDSSTGVLMARILDMDLLCKFFDATNMHRWNDHIRPLDLTELDKQAHKAAIAWVLGRCWELDTGKKLDWRTVIEHSMFSFIERCVMTDIKPPLFHRIKEEKAQEVADYVMSELRRDVPNLAPDFLDRMESYLRDEPESVEDEIIRAAHYLATHWEFDLIYDMNRRSVGIEQTRKDIEAEIAYHSTIIAVMRRRMKNNDFIDLIGQLRFQQRWTRTPRIPATSVLGHSLLVADMTYLDDADRGADDRTVYNDYYVALFHDLPEVLTKDVITPVKVNVDGLSKMLEAYEEEMIESKIMPMIPEELKGEFRFLIYDPFSLRTDDAYGTVCGPEIKVWDTMAAYMEARLSRFYGITSWVLVDGEASLLEKLRSYDCKADVESLVQDLERICTR